MKRVRIGFKLEESCLSVDARYLVVEKEICINHTNSTNRYVGKNKKIISVGENCTNLIKALSLGWRYGKMIHEGLTMLEVANREHKATKTIYRYMNLNYLSPKIVNSIMDSQVPAHIDLQKLFEIAVKYPDFKEQEEVFFQSIK